MILRGTRYLLFSALLFSLACFSNPVLAQRPAPTPNPGATGRPNTRSSPLEGSDSTVDLDIYVRGADGGPIEVTAVVSLVAPTGQLISQGTTLGGNIQFSGVAATEYKIEVSAPGYDKTVKDFDGYNMGKARVDIEMQPASIGEKGAGSMQILLAPKAQKELAKALEALRANKPQAARSHLDEAYHRAPNHPAVNYLYGVYFFQMKDEERAEYCWTKTLEFDPKHVSALLSLSEAMIRERKLPEAESYVKRAVEADPNSWRAHAILADVFLQEGAPQEATKEANRALELGHGQAVIVQPLLARALAQGGNTERAVKVLQEYVQGHPNDAAAGKQLESLISASKEAAAVDAKPLTGTEAERAISVPLPEKGHPEEENASGEAELSPMDPKYRRKAQEALDKAFKLLGPSMSPEGKRWARKDLETAYKFAPASADVNYLFGVYAWQTNDRAQAMSYWKRAAEFNPKYFRALLSLSQALVDENKPDEALPYLERAAQAEPFSWRAHALMAHLYLRQGSPEQAVKHAERAVELGHEEAAVAQRYLSAALAERGEKDKALSILEGFIRNHDADLGAKEQLDKLRTGKGPGAQESAEELLQSDAIVAVTPMPLTSTRWFPPDVDEDVPPVQAGAACSLDEVLRKAGKRVEEFVKNVDRFTANEFLEHESIDKGGFAKSEETRKFDYLVGIEQYRPGYFSVLEYRGNGYSPAEFPDGIATNGLPALALIFHPNSAGNFAMSCEGLSQWDGRPVWQVHFRQRPDKPNTIRAYKLGEHGRSYPVALKGRAWIATDNDQIVRMETTLVDPLPEIRLLADHTVVDYGPVRFKNRNVEMWLPQSAEVYFDWRGKRIHRRHSFSNYMLFSVDEKQKVSEPKTETGSTPRN